MSLGTYTSLSLRGSSFSIYIRAEHTLEFEDVRLSERYKTASADRLVIKLYVVLFGVVLIDS
jgi:hypothetical protein